MVDNPTKMDKDFLLNQSPVFCMIPWASLSVGPDGNVHPCCTAYIDPPLGSLQRSTLREVWNSEDFRQMRKNMLAGQQSRQCARCYEMELSGIKSPRQDYNRGFAAEQFPLVETTTKDGHVERVNIVYMDIRFSNLCNFRCRYCNSWLSTAWYADIKRMHGAPPYSGTILTPCKNSEELMRQVEELVPRLEMIRFSGGEPLISPEHYAVLELLQRHNKTDVQLCYHTNFSVTRYRDKDVFEIWSRFKNVQVAASLDAMGNRGDYIRKGEIWAQTVENRERMLRTCPSVVFSIQPTLTVLNALHLPDFHAEWLDKGYVEPEGIHFNIAFIPEEYCVQILPADFKRRVADRYRKHTEMLRKRYGTRGQQAAAEFESAIEFMQARDTTHLLGSFRKTTRELDQVRGERLEEAFPELAELMKEQ